MKKIYMSPTTKVVKIQTEKMIAVSTVDMYATDATSAGMSRESNSDWDDEDDDY